MESKQTTCSDNDCVAALTATLFPLGQWVATPGALSLLEASDVEVAWLFLRHGRGDWGSLGADDIEANRQALLNGHRLLSAYLVAPNRKVWLITEADRSVTTLLLPEEY